MKVLRDFLHIFISQQQQRAICREVPNSDSKQPGAEKEKKNFLHLGGCSFVVHSLQVKRKKDQAPVKGTLLATVVVVRAIPSGESKQKDKLVNRRSESEVDTERENDGYDDDVFPQHSSRPRLSFFFF